MGKAEDNPFPYLTLVDGTTPATPPTGGKRLFVDSADGLFKWVDDAGTVTPVGGGAAALDDLSDVDLTTTPPSDGDTLVYDAGSDLWVPGAPSGGGGGSAFTAAINSPLQTSLTGWTAGAGTWTAETDRFRLNSSSTAAAMRLFYNTKVPSSNADVKVDVRIDSSTNTTSSRAGIVFGGPATDTTGGIVVALAATGSTTQTTKIHTEIDGVANIADFTLASAITHGTWMTFRVIRFGNVIDVYLNGTLIWSEWITTTTSGTISSIDMRRFALVGFAVDASFRNLTYNSLTLAA